MGKKKSGTTRSTPRKATTAKKKSTQSQGPQSKTAQSKTAGAGSSKGRASSGASVRGRARSSAKTRPARSTSSRSKPGKAKPVKKKPVKERAVKKKDIKKKAGPGEVQRARASAKLGSPPPSKGPPRSLKHLEALAVKSRAECHEFFESAPLEKLLVVFDESFPADLVNLLLDLKKSTVKRFFEVLRAQRRRALAELTTLYYYREYLTNPLPLQVETVSGESVPNYYAILGVPREATEDELKTAHRLLSRAYSPESFSPVIRPAGADRLVEIDDAFDQLKTPSRREHADRLLPNINYLYPRRDQSWLELVQRILG